MFQTTEKVHVTLPNRGLFIASKERIEYVDTLTKPVLVSLCARIFEGDGSPMSTKAYWSARTRFELVITVADSYVEGDLI